MRTIGPAITALALCLAGCGAQMERNGAGENLAAAAGIPDGGGGAPAAQASAETPVGPCPFATRGWEATVSPALQPGEKPSVSFNGEVRPDGSGRMPTIATLGEMKPPLLVLELLSFTDVEPQPDRGWIATGGVFEAYGPQYTHAAISCAGTEIIRVPIRPTQ